MKINEIKSLSNPTIKKMIKLKDDKSFREKEKKCFIIGNKMVKELLKKKIVHTLFSTEKKYLPLFKQSFLIPKSCMQKMTNMKNCEQLAAEVILPEFKTNLSNEKKLLLLDTIQDPGNLGTLIRTAHGLFFDGIIFQGNCSDPFNDKALRSAKGSSFAIALFKLKKEALLNANNYNFYLADLKGENIEKVSFKTPLILILSNESKGPSKWTSQINNKTDITISMKKDIDSLNVAISGAILMHHINSNLK